MTMIEESPASLAVSRIGSQPYCNGFLVGGVTVQTRGDRPTDVALVPLLERFRHVCEEPDVRVRVEWLDRLPIILGSPLFDSGSIWQVYEDEGGFRFDFNVPLLGKRPYRRLLVDDKFREATLQMSEECFREVPYPPDPLEYPLDELLIMHRLTQEKAIELHGCGIVTSGGVGNLFVGHSEAGKSTTTRLWTSREAVEVLSDDRIIVRLDRFSPTRMPMYGTPWHGEAMYASPSSAPLSRIFVLEHGYGNVLTRLTPSQAVSELFARSFVPFYRHEYVDSALAFLQAVVETVPVYRYAFEPDQRAVDTILNFHD